MEIIFDIVQFIMILGIGFLWFTITGKVRDPQKEKLSVAELEKVAKRMKTDLEAVRRDLESVAGRAEKLETRVYLLETTGGTNEDDDF